MGRAKIKPELIKNEKRRLVTFHQRKNSLIKKSRELSTLCDVRMGMIVYGPNAKDPEIWPPNYDNEIKEQIKLYKKQDPCLLTRRTVDVSHYFIERQKKAEMELRKIRLQNKAAKYPTWDDSLDHLSENQLRMFANKLDAKVEAVNAAMIALSKGKLVNFTCTTCTTTDHPCVIHTNMLAPRTLDLNASICNTDYYPNLIDPPLSLPFMNLDGLSSCYQQFSDPQFRESFFGGSSVQLEELNLLQQVHQSTSEEGQAQHGLVVPSFDTDNASPMTNPLMMTMMMSRNDPFGNHGAYMTTNGPIYHHPMTSENMMMNNVNPMSTLPMPLSGVPMPMPLGYFPAPTPPLQPMQPQYMPNLLAGFDGSSGLPDSQINGWYHLGNFQMNN